MTVILMQWIPAVDNNMFENYKKYLEFIDMETGKFFDSQKPYIFCHKGCGLCCKNAAFPYSQLEVTYLLNGYMTLPPEIQRKVEDNLTVIAEAKKKFTGKKFSYDCPFLINNECAVYEYRGVLCRSFGLLTIEGGKIKAPFCYSLGLNYSNVLDDSGKHISEEKFKALKVKDEPTAFNVDYKFLIDEDIEKGFGIKFGEIKPLIDWIIG